MQECIRFLALSVPFLSWEGNLVSPMYVCPNHPENPDSDNLSGRRTDGVCLLLLLHQFDEDFVCEEESARSEAEMGRGSFQQLQV